jgi:RNA polymerase sigma factor FliA
MTTCGSAVQTARYSDEAWRPVGVNRCCNDNHRMILQHMPLLHSIANRVRARLGEGVRIEDLVSAGALGLVEAVERYDDTRGAKFSTFAYPRIWGAMIDDLRTLDWFPRSMRSKANRWKRADQNLKIRLGREPTDHEMAEELGMNSADYIDRVREMASLHVTSIDEMREMASSDSEVLGDGVNEQYHRSAEECAEERDEAAALARRVSALPERLRRFVQLYFYDDMTQREIAAEIGVTESRVSQIRQESIARLRASFRKRQA